jgi:hypothetical protein
MSTQTNIRESLAGISRERREELIAQQALVADPRRWRPRWFDGRFLAASDLQAEQNYFLVRQADIGRAGGAGVVDGLMVRERIEAGTGLEKLRIEPGFGFTDTGELVTLLDALEVEPANVPEMQRLDAAFQLQVVPNESGRNRSGLYVLALRPVEWTANPIAAYPTSLTGARTVEDGTIVEGVAVALIPYPDSSDSEDWNRRRARVARDIFVAGRDHGANSGVLPLAMVALRGNIIEWVDVFMVRRETGSERPAGMDFGFGARALREAHLLQYQEHLAAALQSTTDRPFAAPAYFDALPPIGQFPAGTLDPKTLTQRFFPAGIEVALSFVPDDELPVLIEESLLSPPIDLTAGADSLEGMGVIVLLPLSRAKLAEARKNLPDWANAAPSLQPAFTQLRITAKPATLLMGRLAPKKLATNLTPEEQEWSKLLTEALTQHLVWYVRRRHLPIPSNIAGTPVKGSDPVMSNRSAFVRMIRSDDALGEAFERLRASDIPETSELVGKLTETRLMSHPGLLKEVINMAVGDAAEQPKRENVIAALAATMDPDLSGGLGAIKERNATLAATLNKNIKDPGVLLNVDKLAREVPRENLGEFIKELKTAAAAPKNLSKTLKTLRKKFATP